MLSLLFADDTALLDADTDINQLFERVNSEFYKIATYFQENRLSLHPEKTKFITFSTYRKLNINDGTVLLNNNNPNDLYNPVNNSELQRVKGTDSDPAIKYLCIHIDPMFNFNYHVQNICLLCKHQFTMPSFTLTSFMQSKYGVFVVNL